MKAKRPRARSPGPLSFVARRPGLGRGRGSELDRPATLKRAREIAPRNGVRYACTGNVHDREGGSTYCHGCGEALIGRDWYVLAEWNPTPEGRCNSCGSSAQACSRTGPARGERGGFPCGWGASGRAVASEHWSIGNTKRLWVEPCTGEGTPGDDGGCGGRQSIEYRRFAVEVIESAVAVT